MQLHLDSSNNPTDLFTIPASLTFPTSRAMDFP